MRIDIMTLFPEMCESVLSESIIGRARKNGYVELNCVHIRDFTLDTVLMMRRTAAEWVC